MAIERKANYILEQARVLAGSVSSWVDFSSELFDQKRGLIARTFPDQMEREAFIDTTQYREVNALLLDLMKRFGVKEGAASQKSGKFLVRVPKTLHESLEVEAKREGVSLNQLAVSKLAVPLRESLDLATPLIVEAFSSVHDGYSTDRVVVDPTLNARFLAKCRSLGLNNTEYQLNHALLDIRKSKKAELPRATKRTEFRDYDEYQFAAEIAIRILQRTKAVTLDQVLCDPVIAIEFDNIASRLAPGQAVLKLRCAALNLRKTHRLGPSKQEKKIPEFDLVTAGPLHTLLLPEIPEFPAAYVVYDQNRPIFAGETENLRRRIDIHRTGGLPQWLDTREGFDLVLRQAVVPSVKQDERRLWLSNFVLLEKPLLNFQKVA
jgi:site-specific DNA-methyltransferase (adenine-specific)